MVMLGEHPDCPAPERRDATTSGRQPRSSREPSTGKARTAGKPRARASLTKRGGIMFPPSGGLRSRRGGSAAGGRGLAPPAGLGKALPQVAAAAQRETRYSTSHAGAENPC